MTLPKKFINDIRVFDLWSGSISPGYLPAAPFRYRALVAFNDGTGQQYHSGTPESAKDGLIKAFNKATKGLSCIQTVVSNCKEVKV